MARQVPEGLTGLNAAKSLWAAMLAKIQALKTSDLTNDGDGISPFATQSYVGINGGKIDKIKVNNVEQTITDKTVNLTVPPQTSWYGTSATIAGTAAKTVACSGFTLTAGARIAVKFTYANSATQPTLNVNDTGAKAIYDYGTTRPSTYGWHANEVVPFVYDGSYWQIEGVSADASATSATVGYRGLMSIADKYKLDNIASGATAVTDSTVSGWGYTKNAIPTSQKGAASGVASLGSDGKVPSSQLPAMNYVPTSRTVNGKALSSDITLDIPELSESFSITLVSSAWNNNEQTISNSKFVTSGYGYVVSPAGASYSDYTLSVIYADDVSENGKMKFHCDELPTTNLTVNILKVEVA